MKRVPYPWQANAVEKFKDSDSAAFFMEMRLGKSLAAILWVLLRIRKLKIKNPKILIVTPVAPLLGWINELKEINEPCEWINGNTKTRAKMVGLCKWELMTYKTFMNTPFAHTYGWDAIILDESTVIKNAKSKITKLFTKYIDAKIKCVLSGDPSPQSEDECFTQMAWAYGKWLGHASYWTWRLSWMRPKCSGGWELKLNKRKELKAALHHDSFFLTREQAGVGPIKLYSKRVFPIDSSVKKLINKAEATWEIPGTETKNRLEIVTWIRRMVGGHLPGTVLDCWKYDYLIELLKTELNNQQIVIWFAFKAELARTWRLLRQNEISCTFIQGSTPIIKRHAHVDLFQKGRKRILLAQPACARFGLDLSAANTAIYFSNMYSAEIRKQSEDRIVTVNKKDPLQIIDLISEDSTDVDILELHKNRKDAFQFLSQAIKERTHARLKKEN